MAIDPSLISGAVVMPDNAVEEIWIALRKSVDRIGNFIYWDHRKYCVQAVRVPDNFTIDFLPGYFIVIGDVIIVAESQREIAREVLGFKTL